MVNPITRALQFIEQETVGDEATNIYEALIEK
jgi:hypothetical protein